MKRHNPGSRRGVAHLDGPSAVVSLRRALSKLGHCSRSEADRLIGGARVTVNGRPARDPSARICLDRDRVEVDGKTVSPQKKSYLVMNKPAGVVTTASDERGRRTVYDLLDGAGHRWLAAVGRLDKQSEGLLLFTNDNAWSDAILSPGSGFDKVYHVRIDRRADPGLLALMTAGVRSGAEILKVKSVRLLREGDRNCWLETVLDEGRNRQIRRILEAFGIRVLRLVRIRIGPLELGSLPKSAWRELTPDEVRSLSKAGIKGSAPRQPPGDRILKSGK